MTTGLLLGVKQLERVVDQSPSFSIKVKELLELHVNSPFGTIGTFSGAHINFTLPNLD